MRPYKTNRDENTEYCMFCAEWICMTKWRLYLRHFCQSSQLFGRGHSVGDTVTQTRLKSKTDCISTISLFEHSRNTGFKLRRKVKIFDISKDHIVLFQASRSLRKIFFRTPQLSKLNSVSFFETPISTDPVAQRNIPDHLNFEHIRSANSDIKIIL